MVAPAFNESRTRIVHNSTEATPSDGATSDMQGRFQLDIHIRGATSLTNILRSCHRRLFIVDQSSSWPPVW